MMNCLFRIELLHAYFRSGRLEQYQIVPDPTTRALADRYQLLWQREQGGYALYLDGGREAVPFLTYLQTQIGDLPLRFLITGDMTRFVAITGLETDSLGYLLISSHQRAKEATDAAAGIDLNFFVSGVSAERDDVIGELLVYPSDLLNLGARDVHFRTRFSARELHWQYYLINRTGLPLQNPSICYRGENWFGVPEQVQLPDGEAALSFSSGERSFPLQEKPEFVFDLMNERQASFQADGASVSQYVIKGLPVPGPGQIGIRQNGEQPYVFSAMYVYL